MAISDLADLKGGIASCLNELKSSGFDASAYEIAKWAGVACLIAILVLIISTFLLRSFRNKDLPAALSEPQFALSILIAAALIALPVFAKVTSTNVNVDLASTDITFAQRICEEREDAKNEAVASNANIEAIEQQLVALKTQLSDLENAADPSESIVLENKSRPELLGTAMAIFHREPSHALAIKIEDMLQAKGAGVAVQVTDLTESALLKTAITGDVYIVYASSAAETVKTVLQILKDNGITVKETRGPLDLKGSALQILVF